MTQHQARTRAVIPGKAILGAQGAKREANTLLGGSVVPGRAILGDDGAAEEADKLESARVAAMVVADEKAALGARKHVPIVTRTPKPGTPAEVKSRPAKVPSGMSEKEAVEVIAADPNAWERVLQLEVKRPEGVRVAVARAVVDAAPLAKKAKVPPAMLKKLNRLLATVPAEPAVPASPAVPAAPAEIPAPKTPAVVAGAEPGADDDQDDIEDAVEG